MKYIWRTVIWLSIFILAAFFRLSRINTIPVSLNWDELSIALDAQTIAQFGHDMHGNPWYSTLFPSWGDYKLPIYVLLASAVAFFTKNLVLVARLPSVIVGLLHIGLIGFFAILIVRRFWSKQLNKQHEFILCSITSLMLAVSPWSILFSRTGFEGHAGQFFITLSIMVLFAFPANRWRSIISAILAMVAAYTYFSTRYIWIPLFLVVQLILLLQAESKKTNRLFRYWKDLAWHIVLPSALFLIALLPLQNSVYYQASQQFRLSTPSLLSDQSVPKQVNLIRSQAGNTRLDQALFTQKGLIVKNLFFNISSHLSFDFLFLSGDQNNRHGTGRHGLFLLPFLPCLVLGVYYVFTKSPALAVMLSSWWFMALIPASIPLEFPHALRSLNALTPLTLFISMGVFRLYTWAMTQKLFVGLSFLLGFSLMVFVSIAEFSLDYFRAYPVRSADGWNQGYEQTAQAVYELRARYGTNVPVIVDLPEGRSYLWFMAKSPYRFNFSSWKSDQFQFKYFDGINFTSDLSGFVGQTKDTIVIMVSSAEKIENAMNSGGTLLEKKAMNSLTGKSISTIVVAQL